MYTLKYLCCIVIVKFICYFVVYPQLGNLEIHRVEWNELTGTDVRVLALDPGEARAHVTRGTTFQPPFKAIILP